MRVAITGGTGFIGRHLAEFLTARGDEVVAIARGAGAASVRQRAGVRVVAASVEDEAALADAFRGVDAVAHCAGINMERGRQTFAGVHVRGTEAVVRAASTAGVRRLALISFLRARPDCGSPYHESKWAAEEIVRGSRLTFTVIKEGITYGRGDHMLDHLHKMMRLLPVFATVGFRERPVRPVAVEDAVRVLHSALTDPRLANRTVAVVGPEELPLSEVVRRVARAAGRRVLILRMPVAFHYALAAVLERLPMIPLVSRAQVRMLAEGIAEPLPPCDDLPADLRPTIHLTEDQIRRGLPVLSRSRGSR